MAGFFRVRFGVVQRSRGGSVMRRAAYQSCARIQAPNGRMFDKSADQELHGHVQTIMMAPPGSPSWAMNIESCWSKAMLAERRADAQEGRTMEIALPHILPRHLWEPCVRALAVRFVKAGMIVQADIHALLARTGVLNLHVHFLLSLRRIENGEFSAHKARDWNQMFYRAPKQLRAEIAATLTEFCARHGIHYQADARSNAERGLPAPEMTIPRWNFLAERRKGIRTVWGREIDETRKAREQLAELEAELAAVNRMIQIKETVMRTESINPASPFAAFVNKTPASSCPVAVPRRRVGPRGKPKFEVATVPTCSSEPHYGAPGICEEDPAEMPAQLSL